MKKKTEDLTVVANERLNDEYFVLVLRSSATLPVIAPGQFAEVLVRDSAQTFLRRPISFYDVFPDRREVHLLIREAGAGTRRLARLTAGDTVNLIFPLGHPFSLPEGKRFLLIAGGVGIAPMLLLGKRLREAGKVPVFVFGFRSRAQTFDLHPFHEVGTVHITTEDGSVGHAGLVTAHPVLEESWDGVFSCGPGPMMKAVAAFAGGRDLPCEVSLETLMACGFGACLCCAVETVAGMQRACVEGPVFNAKDLLW